MVWAQMAFRALSQSDKHYPWMPNCPWRDATNIWTSSRHCVPVNRPTRFTERCCCCTCCRKHGRWRPDYLEGLDIKQLFPSQRPSILWLSLQKIVEATLWPQRGLRKRAWNRSKGDRAQLLKEWHSPRAYINWLKSSGSKMTDKSNSAKPRSSICKLNDIPRGARIVPRRYQKTEEWAVPQLLEWSSHSLAYGFTQFRKN